MTAQTMSLAELQREMAAAGYAPSASQLKATE